MACFPSKRIWIYGGLIIAVAVLAAVPERLMLRIADPEAGICLNRLLPTVRLDATNVREALGVMMSSYEGGPPILLTDAGQKWCTPALPGYDAPLFEIMPGNVTGLDELQDTFGTPVLTLHFSGMYHTEEPHVHLDLTPLLPGWLSILGYHEPVTTILCSCSGRRNMTVLTQACSRHAYKSVPRKRSTGFIHKLPKEVMQLDRWEIPMELGTCLIFQPFKLFHTASGYDSDADCQSHRLSTGNIKAQQWLVEFFINLIIPGKHVQVPDGRSVIMEDGSTYRSGNL